MASSQVLLALLFALCYVSSAQNYTQCSLCESMVTFAESYLKSNATVSEIETLLKLVCAQLPSTYQSQCKTLEAELPMLISWLESHTPHQFCVMAHMCAAAPAKKLPFVRVGKNFTQCTLCENLVNYADLFLRNNGSLTQAEAALKLICSALPSPWNTQCQTFAAELPMIAELLKNTSPEQLCTKLGLCAPTPTPRFAAAIIPILQHATAVNYTQCSLCKMFMVFAHEFVEGDVPVDEIQTLLKAACTAVPARFQPECSKLVDQVPQLIQAIKNQSPEQICTSLSLCA